LLNFKNLFSDAERTPIGWCNGGVLTCSLWLCDGVDKNSCGL
jgi:hypothetical protein